MKTNKRRKTICLFIALAVVFAACLALAAFLTKKFSRERRIEDAVGKTKEYMTEKEFGVETFADVLQSFLNEALVYAVEEDEYLIVYKGENYLYGNDRVRKSSADYIICENLNEAIARLPFLAEGESVFTKGFYVAGDGGNARYQVVFSACDEGLLSYGNEEETKFLVLDGSIVNVYQTGYKSGESLDGCINRFTEKLKYKSVYVPGGSYVVTDNFDVNVSDKNYYAFDACLYSDDGYAPAGANNGCLFYVYNDIRNIRISGFDLTVKTNKKLDDPLLGFLSARDVNGLFVNDCSFYLSENAHIYPSSGIIDLFTGWKNVTVKNCRLENHASTVGGGGIGVRDIYEKKCANAVFENNYLYSNCRDEVIAIFSGVDTSLGYNDGGNGLIENVTFKNNTIVGGEQNLEYTVTPRVVGITVGYQKSPVRNVSFLHNDIEIYSANYFLLYGKADTVEFRENDIGIDASFQDKLYKLICHNSYADDADKIIFDKNRVEMKNHSSLYTVAQSGEELAFTRNTLKGEKVFRLFDSPADFSDNIINFTRIENCVYRNIGTVKRNKIDSQSVNVVYEFYNLNVGSDIVIEDDCVTTDSIDCNFMMFNGTEIRFNGHSVSFSGFKLIANSTGEEKYYYLAYGTSAIKDGVVINFINCRLSVYEAPGHKVVVEKNEGDEKKVSLFFMEDV